MKKNKANKNLQYFHAEFKSIKRSEAKGVDAQEAVSGTVIKGYASTDTLDRYNDIVEPTAFTDSIKNEYKKNPIILFQHKSDRPIGKATFMSIDDKGLYIEALIVDDEVEPKIQAGILKAFSIGFRPKEWKYQDADGKELDPDKREDLMRIYFEEGIKFIITKLELLENSVVSIPANPDALFSLQKSLKDYREHKTGHNIFTETKEHVICEIEGEDAKAYIFKFSKEKEWDVEDAKAWMITQFGESLKNFNSIIKEIMKPERKNLLEDPEIEIKEVVKKEEIEKSTEPISKKEEPTEVIETPADEISGKGEGDEISAEDDEVVEPPADDKEKVEGDEVVKEEPTVEASKDAEVVIETPADDSLNPEMRLACKTIKTLADANASKDAEINDLKKQLDETPAKQANIEVETIVDSEKNKKPGDVKAQKEKDANDKKGFKNTLFNATR